MIVSSGGKSETGKRREARSHLCQTYWRPIFVFISRLGYEVEDAQDLTQEFFMTIVEGNLFGQADPARGRFRTLLLKALQNFLTDAKRRRSTSKRGGKLEFV
ncbi:MAG TPA: ECF-type sigma factor, partial [Chthoniobacterales bacterium]|nr:ECF-type sigma factor [Chthoniobacterales bacterium]